MKNVLHLGGHRIFKRRYFRRLYVTFYFTSVSRFIWWLRLTSTSFIVMIVTIADVAVVVVTVSVIHRM